MNLYTLICVYNDNLGKNPELSKHPVLIIHWNLKHSSISCKIKGVYQVTKCLVKL
mgnify:CR=1 FL=1